MLQGALRSSRSLTVWARFKIGAAFFAIAKNLETVRPYFHEVTRLRCFSDATLDRRSDDRLATFGQYAAGFAHKGIPIVGWRVWAHITKAHAGRAGAVEIRSIGVAGQRNECPILRSTPLSSLDDMAISSAMSPREPAAPAPSAKSTTAKMTVASTVKCEPPTSILKKRLEGRARHAGRAPLSDGHRRVVQLRPCVDVNTKALIVTAL